MARPFALYTRTLVGAMPRQFAVAMTLTALGTVTEGVGLLVLVPLLSLIGVDVLQGALAVSRPGWRQCSAGSACR